MIYMILMVPNVMDIIVIIKMLRIHWYLIKQLMHQHQLQQVVDI